MFRLLFKHLVFPEKPVSIENTEADAGQPVRPLPEGWNSRSVHVRHVDCGSCNGCDWEMNALLNPVYDIQRFGIDFVASPRHADMLMVTGGVTRHLREALEMTYAATPDPKLVVAIGDCACGTGLFNGSYAAGQGAEEVVPVHLKIPGCPPEPKKIIAALLMLQM